LEDERGTVYARGCGSKGLEELDRAK